MNEEVWFGYPIWYKDVLYSQNEELLKYCVLKKIDDVGRQKSNAGGWQSNELFESTDLFFSNFCQFLSQQINIVSERLDVKVNLHNLWININGYGTYNHTHTHPGSYFSGVYYVKANSTQGKIIFEHPLKIINGHMLNNGLKKYDEIYGNEISYTPETGKLILFPSFLAHRVETNNTNLDRISISFNTLLVG